MYVGLLADQQCSDCISSGINISGVEAGTDAVLRLHATYMPLLGAQKDSYVIVVEQTQSHTRAASSAVLVASSPSMR